MLVFSTRSTRRVSSAYQIEATIPIGISQNPNKSCSAGKGWFNQAIVKLLPLAADQTPTESGKNNLATAKNITAVAIEKPNTATV